MWGYVGGWCGYLRCEVDLCGSVGYEGDSVGLCGSLCSRVMVWVS